MRKLVLAGVLVAFAAATVSAHAVKIAAAKITRQDISGDAFHKKDAVRLYRDDYIDTDVPTFASKNSAFKTGLYQSGPIRYYIQGPEDHPDDEVLYLTSGSVTLTSSDGSVTVINTGEGVTLPKGWTGTFDTLGYTKIYAIYRRPAGTSPNAGRMQ